MESFDKVWDRLLQLVPPWEVQILSTVRTNDTTHLTWLNQLQDGVMKTTVRYQEEESVQRVERSKLEVLFFPNAKLETDGRLDEKKHKTKAEVHKTELEILMPFKKGFLGFGGSFSPKRPVPREHKAIREYANKIREQHEERQARVKTVQESEDAAARDQAVREASGAFFGS